MSTVRFSTNGSNGTLAHTASKPATGRRKARRPANRTVSQARKYITIGMGCGIPMLSLALSSIGGRLVIEGHSALGAAGLVLCGLVLTVSLSHLAKAVADITRSNPWQSWCLAVAIDLSLVLGELAGVASFEFWLVGVVMVSVTIVSAILNCWAFLRH